MFSASPQHRTLLGAVGTSHLGQKLTFTTCSAACSCRRRSASFRKLWKAVCGNARVDRLAWRLCEFDSSLIFHFRSKGDDDEFVYKELPAGRRPTAEPSNPDEHRRTVKSQKRVDRRTPAGGPESLARRSEWPILADRRRNGPEKQWEQPL